MRDVNLPKRYTNGSTPAVLILPRRGEQRLTAPKVFMTDAGNAWGTEPLDSWRHQEHLPAIAFLVGARGIPDRLEHKARGIPPHPTKLAWWRLELTHFGELFGFHDLFPRVCLGRETSNTPGLTTTPACCTGPSQPHFRAVPFPGHSAALLSHDQLFANLHQ